MCVYVHCIILARWHGREGQFFSLCFNFKLVLNLNVLIFYQVYTYYFPDKKLNKGRLFYLESE